MTTTASSRPGLQAVEHLLHRHDLAAQGDVYFRRRRAGLLAAPASTCLRHRAEIGAVMLAVSVTMRCML